MNLATAFEIAPKSEQTLIRHGFIYRGLRFRNDTPYGPCFYRLEWEEDGTDLGGIKYYGGRKLAAYELEPSGAKEE